jgi:hypothetical protein
MIKDLEIINIIPKNQGHRRQLLVNGEDMTAYLTESRFIKPVTVGIGTFTMTLYNPGGLKSGSYKAGHEVKLYADHENGTTLQFWGIIDNVKERKDDKGQFLDFEGRHRSYMATERMVCYSTENRECSLILKDLIDTYLPGFTYDSVLPSGVYMPVSWNYKKVWECVEDICNFCGFDCYVDDNLDIHFFQANSIYNENDAVVEGQNFIKVVDWGTDEYFHKTSVTAIGEDESGMMIVYTAHSDDYDPDNPKEVFIKDVSAKTYAAVKARAEAELAKYDNIAPRGTVQSIGLEEVNPGDNIVYALQRHKIVGAFKLLVISHLVGTKIEKGGWIVETSIEREIIGTSQIVKDSKQNEKSITYADNVNRMEYSYNFTFDDESDISSMSNTVVDGGALKLASGTTGSMTSDTKNAEITISQLELRAYGTDLGVSTYQVSCDGTNYINVTPNTLTTVPEAVRGNKLIVIPTLIVDLTTNPTPALDSLGVFYS